MKFFYKRFLGISVSPVIPDALAAAGKEEFVDVTDVTTGASIKL